jgi:hypothetical protein
MRVYRWVNWVRVTLMALKIRLEYAGAAYHVMARGNQGRDICDDERDRRLCGWRRWAKRVRRPAGASMPG